MIWRTTGRARSTTLILLAFGAVVACNGDDAPKNGNGVNDVRLACEIRAKWNRTDNDCSICESAVISPRCECSSLSAYSAACFDQAEGRRSACTDDAIDIGIQACDRADCACIDGCYANAEACKAAAAARDGCIAEACDQHCK